jgi:DNA-directed RNA polymerase subunit RPC12/RpoP
MAVEPPMALFLLKQKPDAPVHVPGRDERPDDRSGGPRIRCPRCAWEPERHHQWTCTCLHCWNTFDTRGICPACGRFWAQTQCPRCSEWSMHEAWYAEEGEGR